MAYKNPNPELDVENSEKLIESENDYRCLKDVYFAFIDVLGFKKAFDDMRLLQEEKEAEKYKDVFNYYFSLMNSAKFMAESYAGQTSDSLYFYTERSDFLVKFMKLFSYFNLYAMSKNVFFRGGIAKGNLFQKEKYQFYGNSVIYAYLLESVISKYPIIVIDENTNSDLKEELGYRELVDEKNGRIYIKPFVYLDRELDIDLDGYEVMKIDKDIVIKNVEYNKSLFEFDPKNYEKYVFLENELKKKR